MNEWNVFIVDELGMGGISTNVRALQSKISESWICQLRKFNRENNIDNVLSKFGTINKLRFINTRVFLHINSARGLLFALLLCLIFRYKKGSLELRIVFMTYHPNEFSNADFFSTIYRGTIHKLGKKNIWFMNESCFSKHFIYSKNNIQQIYLNLVIDDKFSKGNGKNAFSLDGATILTVARLVDFKIGYIKNLIRYSLYNKKIQLKIVGSGPLKDELAEIIEIKSAKNIKLIPAVSHHELNEYYLNSSIYVGMGTTLLEASSMGLPSIVAIVSENDKYCYGWFSNQKNFNVGEIQPDIKKYDMFRFLDDYFELSIDKKQAIANIHYAHFQKFSIHSTLERFNLNLSESENNKINTINLIRLLLVFVLASSFEFIRFNISNASRYNAN